MADTADIMAFQKKFDKEHGWAWTWTDDTTQNVRNLQKAVVALTGEVGEFANLVKKAGREHDAGNALPDGSVERMREEIADIFTYLIKLALLLGLDLADSYYKKMTFNAERFKRFEVKGA